MTELETMKRAEEYLRKMANGINPLTGEPAVDDDMVNNVRITRCLYYVSDILKQVIDNNGVITKKNSAPGKKADFFITDEQRAALTEFDRPAYASELAGKINALTENNNCKKFAARWVAEYFVSIGLLYIDNDSKRATEAGVELGIISENRKASYMPKAYWVNAYSPEAQRFIIDNIDSIIAFAKTPQYKQQTHPDRTSNDSAEKRKAPLKN